MQYSPLTAVWEITMGCNMRCKHCGSACKEPLPGELSTEEALDLCDQVADLGLKWITLSGGEPLTRKDWPLLVKRLSERGVVPNMISNGWLFTREVAKKARDAGIGTIAISLDGPKDVHDYIRKEGSYERILKAFSLMREYGISSGAVTTLHRMNMERLAEFKESLIEGGVRYWQVQIGLPMGNMGSFQELLMPPEEIDRVIDFAHETMLEKRINIYLADCIGYYNIKELEVRKGAHDTPDLPFWLGCNAGKRSFGILHNGQILGCTSIRDRKFIEGTIREKSLREIWESEDSFTWSRSMKKSSLSGLCAKCFYGDSCLGGCPNTRLTMNGDIYSENRYCSYNVALKKTLEKVSRLDEKEDLFAKAGEYAQKGQLQLAGMLLERAMAGKPDDINILSLYGFVSFMLTNYEAAKEANEKALRLKPDDAYANKGMGLSLCRLGRGDEGIEYLKRAVGLADNGYMDPYHDLAVVYIESNRHDEALEILKQGRTRSEDFRQATHALYTQLVEHIGKSKG